MIDVSNNMNICKSIIEIINKSDKEIYLIGIVGAPGSGKTTTAKILQKNLENSVHFPLDGYHTYLKDLNEEQKKRRGSPETFNLKKFREDIIRLKQCKNCQFPDFDHAKKDPEENIIQINQSHKFIIIEGLWIFLKELDIDYLFDLKIYLECSKEEMYNRLIYRHIKAGLEKNEEDAFNRIKFNDELNFIYLKNNTIIDNSYYIFKT